MPFPIDLTRCLAFTHTDTPLRVLTIPLEAARAKLAMRGLHEGDEIVVDLACGGDVVVTSHEGRRILVESRYAVMIEVEPRGPFQGTAPLPMLQRGDITKSLVAVSA